MEARGSIRYIYKTNNYYDTRKPYSSASLVKLSLPVNDVNSLLFRFLDTISGNKTCMSAGKIMPRDIDQIRAIRYSTTD